jgi:hypothetical protein
MPYLATEAAILRADDRALAREALLIGPERRITINVAAPGLVNTAAFAANTPESASERAPAEAHPSAGGRMSCLSLRP